MTPTPVLGTPVLALAGSGLQSCPAPVWGWSDPSLHVGKSGRGIALNMGFAVVEASLKGLTAGICLLTPISAAETSLSFLKRDPGGPVSQYAP